MDKSPTPHIVIVIDGLDECSDEDAQRDILDAIASVCHNPQLPLLFLVSSRPERQLRESFSDDYIGDITIRIALDNSQDPDRDIKLFLDCKFAEIRRKNPSLDRCWPLSSIIDQLVEKASGQFVYASTVVKYVGSPRRDPRRSLEIILGICTTPTQSDYPFKDLDALYMLILDTVYEESSEIVSAVLTTLIFSGSDFVKLGSSGARSPAYFDQLLLLDDGQIYHHLADMHSLLEIPHFIHRTSDIRITHASLSDFLTNPLRAGAHYVSRERGETRLAKLCFRVLLASLAAVPQAPNHPGLVVFTIRSLLARAGPSKSLQEVSEIFLATYDDEYVPTFKFKDMHLPCASNLPYNLLPMLIVATQLYLQRCASTAPRSSRLEEASPTTTVKHLIDKLLLR